MKFFKHKFCRRYLLDPFGQYMYQNTKHNTSLHVRYFLRQRLHRFLFTVKNEKSRLSLRKKFYPRKKNKKFQARSIFSVSDKARPKNKKPLSQSGLLLAFRRKVFFYHGLKSQSLRQKSYLKASPSRFLECRLDALLLRSNFMSSIWETRKILLRGYGLVAVPRNNYSYSFRKVSLPSLFIPPFTAFSLSNPYENWRRNFLARCLSNHKIVSLPPSYLLVSYKLFLSFLLRLPRSQEVRYAFGGRLSTTIGLARYY